MDFDSHRKAEKIDIADAFIKAFASVYAFSEEDLLCFYVILSQRVIGGYMDAMHDRVTNVPLQDELQSRILKMDIIS